jgi:hypothetical protein
MVFFKVDIWLTCDYFEYECSICAAEARLPIANNKEVVDDLVKLLEEGKADAEGVFKVPDFISF